AVDEQQALHDAFVATETLLGEERLDRWIGAIRVVPLESTSSPWRFWKKDVAPPADSVNLGELKGRVDALVEALRWELPSQPYFRCARDEKWSILKLPPANAEDYPGQHDLFVAKTMRLDLWEATHTEAPFADERFSRHGETFAYVKLDGSAPLQEGFADKSEI